jgi:hypothetical protein
VSDVWVTIVTGSGKFIYYQLPTMTLGGATVIIFFLGFVHDGLGGFLSPRRVFGSLRSALLRYDELFLVEKEVVVRSFTYFYIS